MRKFYKNILILLFTIISAKSQIIYADTTEVDDKRILIDVVRFKSEGTNKIMELLGIKPGMTILDIGAGTGQYAYEFAKRLEGTGKVFATDTDAGCINYMKEEANRRGLTNFYPVLVKKKELDEFYSRQKYDLITIFHVNIVYVPQDYYFRELKRFLADNGRLIIVLYKNFPHFTIDDFTGDFKGLINELSTEPDGSPFYKSLGKTTRDLIGKNLGNEPGEPLKKAVAGDFNKILSDSNFSSNFADGMVFKEEVDFSAEEKDFAGWLLLFSDNIYGKNKESLKVLRAKKAEQLNRLLIFQKFRRYLNKDRMVTSEFAEGVKKVLGTAGYKLEKEYKDLLSFEDVLIFTVDKKTSGE